MRKALLFLFIFIAINLNTYTSDHYLRLKTNNKTEHPETKALVYFSKLVERKTGNKILVEVKSDERENDVILLEQLSFGGISFALVDLDYLFSYVPSIKNLEKQDIEALNKELEKYNFIALSIYPRKKRAVFFRSKEIDHNENLTVVTVGSSYYVRQLQQDGFTSYTIELEDAAPLMLDFNIAGTDASIVDFAYSEAYPFSNFCYIREEESLPSVLVMNKKIFNALNKDEKLAIKEAARLSKNYAANLLKRAEETIFNRLEKESTLMEFENG